LVAVILLQGLATLATLGLLQALPTFAYPGTLEMLAVALLALSWGAAPALGSTVVGALLLEYAVLPGRMPPHAGPMGSLAEVGVLLLAGSIMTLLASRVESVRRREARARMAAQARELAARETNVQMDAFLGIAGHELRNPLATMLATIQLAERRLRRLGTQSFDIAEELAVRLDPIQTLLGRAERQVRLQDRLVGDLLDTSRIHSNRLELRPQPCDLALIVADAVEEQRLAWPARTIELEAVGAVPMCVDADRIGQVVTNYLTNALKYSPAATPVRVVLSVDSSVARLAVRDEGPGLPTEEQQRIWERFHRAEGVRVLDGGGVGLGLGLHISRTIVERQGGTVGVRSSPGKGSTFWFTLPLYVW
jgi:signal transduction histidine kinase